VLNGLKRGIEKESLRVRTDGALALTPHPAALGSALKHPHITTDFSEALIELITGVHTRVEACREELKHIHQFVYRHIGDEVLWGASMPCSLPDENAIPIARYGNSNVGRAKTVYRIGLAHRYGKRMQMIAGLHYNWSLPRPPGRCRAIAARTRPTSLWCAISGGMRGSCSISSAPRPRYARASSRAASTRWRSSRPARSTCRTQRRSAWAPRLPLRSAGLARGELQQHRQLHRLSRRRAHPALPAVRSDRHPRR